MMCQHCGGPLNMVGTCYCIPRTQIEECHSCAALHRELATTMVQLSGLRRVVFDLEKKLAAAEDAICHLDRIRLDNLARAEQAEGDLTELRRATDAENEEHQRFEAALLARAELDAVGDPGAS